MSKQLKKKMFTKLQSLLSNAVEVVSKISSRPKSIYR